MNLYTVNHTNHTITRRNTPNFNVTAVNCTKMCKCDCTEFYEVAKIRQIVMLLP